MNDEDQREHENESRALDGWIVADGVLNAMFALFEFSPVLAVVVFLPVIVIGLIVLLLCCGFMAIAIF